MQASEAAALALSFLRQHLAEKHPPPAPGTATDTDFSTTILRVEVEGERILRAVFGVGMPFRFGDTRPIERINASLGALMAAHPALRAFRLEVQADDTSPQGSPAQKSN